MLESQATSVYPLKTHFHDGHTFKWLDKQIAFSKWVDRHQSNLIHIHGTSMVSEAAEYAFHKLSADPESPGEEVILYFKFDRHDQRRNSIRAMAITFLAQILGRFRNSPSTFITELESPLFGQTLTEKDAFFLLNSVRIELVSKTRVSWILDGLDECDPVSSQWFLSEILGILERSEMYLKVLVTTVDDKRIRDTLAKHPQIDMKNHIGDQLEHPIAPRTFAHQLYLELLAQRPEIQPCYAEIENLFRGCWTDRELSGMIFEWLLATRDSITKRFVKKVVAALSPPSPQKTLGWMLGSVSEEDRPWIRKLMLWVLHSAKPLNPDELTSALFLSSDASDNELDDWMPLDFMPEISRSFKWLFVIENNEVRFKHPATAKYLTTDTADEKRKAPWYEFATPGAGHQEITQTCVKFLRNTAIMNGIKTACGAPRDSRLVLDRVEDFQSYAIQFWPYHFKLALKEDQQADLQGDIAQFLQDSDALGCWFQANRHFTAPHLQASSSSIHLLPIFSYLGLKKQVQELVAGLTDSEEKDELMACALIEAARVGNKGIVDDLLRDPGTISLGPVMDAMEAASISGEFSTLADLLSYTVAKHEMSSYRWPHILLCRLAWAGEDGLLEDYLKLEVSAGSPDNDHGDVPSELYCACTRNQTGAIRVLLERRSDTKLHDPKRKNRTALHVAAKYGQVAAIKALVSAGATVDAEDDYERPAVYWAAILAQQEALGALLDAGADPKFFETMTPKPDGWPGIITVAIPAYEKCLRLLLDHDVDVNCVRPKDGSTAISRAAYNKLLDICRLLLERGANVDGSERSRTLVLAASTGSVELVRLLLDHGADINTKQENSHWKGTSLMAAAERNFKDVVKFLLEKEAEINVTVDGEDALWRAASRGSGDAASLLLAAGAERNRKSGTGSWSPLHVAYSDPECLKVLLEAGLDTEVTPVDSTALYLASFHGQTESVRLFIKHGANVEVSCVFPGLTDSEFTPLLAAAMNGHAPIVRALLEAGANPRATAPDKQTALHLAIGSKSIPTVMALLEYNPDLDAKTDGGSAVLHLPNSKTSPDLVRPIVNRGADIEIRNKNGYTPLNRAVLQQNTELVKFFIAAKANVNVVDSYWGGPLHVAVTRQNLDLVKLLLESGADVNLMDPVYGTPLANVCIVDTTDKETKHKIIRYLLQDAGADINACGGILGTALHAACLRDGVDIIKSLLVSGADVNCPDVFDRRPIHHATFRTVDHMSLLLSSGADIHARDKLGRTALHTAVASGRVDVVQKVLSLTNGLINEPDVDGWTPLLWATRPCREWGGITSNQAEILKLLISRGANLWVKGKGVDQEWSALKLAKYHSASPEIIALLTPDIKKRVKEDGDEETWDPQLHRSRKARSQNGYCDACLYASASLSPRTPTLPIHTMFDSHFANVADTTELIRPGLRRISVRHASVGVLKMLHAQGGVLPRLYLEAVRRGIRGGRRGGVRSGRRGTSCVAVCARDELCQAGGCR